jgi:hypothetical protein
MQMDCLRQNKRFPLSLSEDSGYSDDYDYGLCSTER